jgi:hypothetical protein
MWRRRQAGGGVLTQIPAEFLADRRRQFGLLSSTTLSLPTMPSTHHFVSCRVSEVCALFLPHPSFSLPLSLAHTTVAACTCGAMDQMVCQHIWHAETIFLACHSVPPTLALQHNTTYSHGRQFTARAASGVAGSVTAAGIAVPCSSSRHTNFSTSSCLRNACQSLAYNVGKNKMQSSAVGY